MPLRFRPQTFCTTVDTLCRDTHSMLAAMFSGGSTCYSVLMLARVAARPRSKRQLVASSPQDDLRDRQAQWSSSIETERALHTFSIISGTDTSSNGP